MFKLRFLRWFASRSEPISDEQELVEYDTDAVLAIVQPQFHGNSGVGVEIGSNNEQTIAEDRALIAKYRNWLKTQPRNVIRAYEYWLRYYEYGCDRAERAIAGNAKQKFDDRWKQTVAKINATAELARTYPKLEGR